MTTTIDATTLLGQLAAEVFGADSSALEISGLGTTIVTTDSGASSGSTGSSPTFTSEVLIMVNEIMNIPAAGRVATPLNVSVTQRVSNTNATTGVPANPQGNVYPRAEVNVEGTTSYLVSVNTVTGNAPVFQNARNYQNDPSVAVAIMPGQGFINTPTVTAVGNKSCTFPTTTAAFNQPGEGTVWGLGFWDGPVYAATAGSLLDSVQSVGFVGVGIFGRGSHGLRRYDFLAEDLNRGTPYFTTVTSSVADVTTFAGAGVLNVVSTVGLSGLAGQTIVVQTSTGSATITYTGATSTSFTGCTCTAGTGAISVGRAVSRFDQLPAGAQWTTTTGTIANITTFAGAGTLNVVSTAGFGGNAADQVTLVTSTGYATVSYTGRTATSFTGCTCTAGTGSVAAGAIVARRGIVDTHVGLIIGNLQSDGVSVMPLTGGITNFAAWIASQVQFYPSDFAFSTVSPFATGMVNISNTMATDVADIGRFFDIQPTVRWLAAGNAFGSVRGYQFRGTYMNDASVAVSPGLVVGHSSTPHIQANAQTIAADGMVHFLGGGVHEVINSGSLTSATDVGFQSNVVVNAGAVLALRTGMTITDVTGGGLVQKQIGVDVPYLTAGQYSIGLRLGSRFATPAPATRTVASAAKVIPDAAFVVLTSTGTAAITLGSTTVPAIAPGVADGERFTVLNIGTNDLVWTDGRGIKLNGPAQLNQKKNTQSNWLWSASLGVWIGSVAVGSSAAGPIVATVPGTWAPNGFLGSVGQYLLSATDADGFGAGRFVKFAPYLQYSVTPTVSHTVVANKSILSNDPATSAVTLAPSFTLADTQTIRSDTQTNTVASAGIGLGHQTVRSVLTVDAVNSGAWATTPDVYVSYAMLTARAAAGKRWGSYFESTVLQGASTTSNLHPFVATQICSDGGPSVSTTAGFTSLDSGKPIIDAAGVIPTAKSGANDNLISAAFLAGTGVLTLNAAASAYGLSGSGVVAVFNYSTNAAAVAGTVGNVAYITFTGTSGSTLTGCKNMSAQNSSTDGNFTTTSGSSLIAFVKVTPLTSDYATLNQSTQHTETSGYIGETSPGSGVFVVRSTLNAFSAADVNNSIIDSGGLIIPGTVVTAVGTNVLTNDQATLSIPTTGNSFASLSVICRKSTTNATNALIVCAPVTTPAGSVVQQVANYVAYLGTVATNYNVGYWWDDGTGAAPTDNSFYGIWSPAFQVNGLTGSPTLTGIAAAATQNMRRIDGTLASPTAIANGEVLASIVAQGQYDTTVGHLVNAGSLRWTATQAFTSTTAIGTKLELRVGQNGVGIATALTLNSDLSAAAAGALTAAGNIGFNGKTAQALTGWSAATATALRTAAPNATYSTTGATGATAGAFDTAAHRDNVITDLANTMRRLGTLIADLTANGAIG